VFWLVLRAMHGVVQDFVRAQVPGDTSSHAKLRLDAEPALVSETTGQFEKSLPKRSFLLYRLIAIVQNK
jgi:hypothetical protein